MQSRLIKKQNFYGKPFLKWIGGKRQLINEIEKRLPQEILETKTINLYFEPFLGGGSVFFHLKNNYTIKKSIISDINPELILTYQTIKNNPQDIISNLKDMKEQYLKLNPEKQKEYYLSIRETYNNNLENFNFNKYSKKHIERASQTIFMNKTCFNGMFRVNKDGKFNVPAGRYKNPSIYDEDNILEIHRILNDNVIIKTQDFSEIEEYVNENSFIYLDPPYRPLNKTSNFTQYYKDDFKEEDQIRLSKFIQRLTTKNSKIMLSNSNSKINNNESFFEKHYPHQKIDIVKARRNINANAKKRNEITELIITNY